MGAMKNTMKRIASPSERLPPPTPRAMRIVYKVAMAWKKIRWMKAMQALKAKKAMETKPVSEGKLVWVPHR